MSALRATELPRLARDASELRGRRAARWIRESTPGQLDRWGPPSQRRMPDVAIEELGLTDTGLAWTVGRSGWSGPDSMDDPPATRTPEFRAMLAAAEAGAFDVLLVGYTARYMRDLALALSYRRWFHRQGVSVYICDDRILTSNAADWERFVDKCKAAEINSRSRAATSGRAMPPSARRTATRAGIRRSAFGAPGTPRSSSSTPSGSGRRRPGVRARRDRADRPRGRRGASGSASTPCGASSPRRSIAVGCATGPWPIGIASSTTRHGNASRTCAPPAIGARRADPRRAGPMPCRCSSARPVAVGWSATRTAIATSKPARPFMAARPAGGQVRGRHRRIPGQSYGRDEYEAIVPFVLERVRLGAQDIDDAADAYARGTGAEPNQLRLARIEEERDRAVAAYRRDRDPLALEQTMRDLDASEAETRGDRDRPGLPPDEVRRYLEHLPAWWADADPDDRRALATTLFERIRVLGISQVALEPTQEARDHGLAEAFGPDEVEMVGARGDKPPLGTSMSRPICPLRSRLRGRSAGWVAHESVTALVGRLVGPVLRWFFGREEDHAQQVGPAARPRFVIRP